MFHLHPLHYPKMLDRQKYLSFSKTQCQQSTVDTPPTYHQLMEALQVLGQGCLDFSRGQNWLQQSCQSVLEGNGMSC